MRVEQVDTPRAGSADTLIKVAYCGVCGSDAPRIVMDAAHYYPIILGHEFSGVIVDVGDDLSPDLKGRKAVCAPLMPDFSDPQCAKGNYSLGKGYEFVFEVAGAPAAEILALKLAAPKATVMFVGTPHSALTLQPAEFELINRKELTLKDSWLNYSAPFPGWEWQYGVEMLTKQQVDIAALVGSTLPLSQANRLPALLSECGDLKRKIVLDCSA